MKLVFLDPVLDQAYALWETRKNSTNMLIRQQRGRIQKGSSRAQLYDGENPEFPEYFCYHQRLLLDTVKWIARHSALSRVLLSPGSDSNLRVYSTAKTLYCRLREEDDEEHVGRQGRTVLHWDCYNPDNLLRNNGAKHFYAVESRAAEDLMQSQSSMDMQGP